MLLVCQSQFLPEPKHRSVFGCIGMVPIMSCLWAGTSMIYGLLAVLLALTPGTMMFLVFLHQAWLQAGTTLQQFLPMAALLTTKFILMVSKNPSSNFMGHLTQATQK